MPLMAAAQFNFSLDTLLGRNQSQSKAQCPDCAGAIRSHVVAPSASSLPLTPSGGNDPRMDAFARAMRSPASVGLLVLKGTEIQFEGYTEGVNGQTGVVSFSRAKSIISLAIGQALCAGKIPSLEVRAQDLVPELAQTVYGRAKIKSLLTMASGAATGLPHGDTVPGESGRWLQGVKTQLKTLQDYPGEAIPLFVKTGEGIFKYKNQDTSALVLILQAVEAGRIEAWFDERVWKPVRAEGPVMWALDRGGAPIGPAFFGAGTRDWGRLGHYINQTLRGENQESCFRDYLLAATRRQVSTGNSQFQGYGYQMWTHFHRDRVGDVVWFRGVGGQLLALHPPSNSVMVYSALNESVTEQVAAAFVDLVH